MPSQKSSLNIPELSLTQFVHLTATNKPEITGGCVVLTTAGLALALILMALEMSRSKSRNIVAKVYLKDQGARLRELQKALSEAAARDLDVFNKLRNLPVSRLERKSNHLYLQALTDSIQSPLDGLNILNEIIAITGDCRAFCKKSLISDLESGLLILNAVLKSLLLLTKSNIKSLPPSERKHYNASIQRKQEASETIFNEAILKANPVSPHPNK